MVYRRRVRRARQRPSTHNTYISVSMTTLSLLPGLSCDPGLLTRGRHWGPFRSVPLVSPVGIRLPESAPFSASNQTKTEKRVTKRGYTPTAGYECERLFIVHIGAGGESRFPGLWLNGLRNYSKRRELKWGSVVGSTAFLQGVRTDKTHGRICVPMKSRYRYFASRSAEFKYCSFNFWWGNFKIFDGQRYITFSLLLSYTVYVVSSA